MVMKASYPVEIREREASAAGIGLPVSTKKARFVCDKINGLPVDRAKRFLEALIDERIDIDGQHFTSAAQRVLEVLESATKNAEFRGLGKLRVRTVTAEEGPHRMRRKRQGGRKFKLTHVKIVLEETERPAPKKTEEKKQDGHKHAAEDEQRKPTEANAKPAKGETKGDTQ